MKKEYNCPHVWIESFELCEHIAVTCPVINSEGGWATHWDRDVCAFSAHGPADTSIMLFLDSENGCEYDASGYESDTALIDYHGTQLPLEMAFSS